MVRRFARRAFLLFVLAAADPVRGGVEHIFSNDFESGTTSGWDFPIFCPQVNTYRLTESGSGLALWTVPAAHKVRSADVAPTEAASGLRMFAARREFEPLVVAMRATGGGVTVTGATLAPFPNLGAGASVDVRTATFTGGWADGLVPFAPTAVGAAAAQALWITLRVPEDAPWGRHDSALTLTVAGQPSIVVPVELYVFDAELPPDATFESLLYVTYSSADDPRKQLMFDHRLSAPNATFPSGFDPGITWDQNAHPATSCTTFDDQVDHENPAFALGHLADEWLLGEGWNGVGFPLSLAFDFVDNDTPRPPTFCGISRESGSSSPQHWGSAAYNAEWSAFLAGLDAYLVGNDLEEKVFYYVQSEPANVAAYDLAAHLCRLTRAAAPNLRIAVSEQPRPRIAENPAGACGYDLWITHFGDLRRHYAHSRQLLGEEVWLYSLDADFFVNPTREDRQGMDVRALPWIAWADRARGWGYYDGASFFHDGGPSVRLELLREGFEDYEYLVLANGGIEPRPGVAEIADATARSVAHDEIDWNRDADAQATLRCELGRFLEGSRTDVPRLARAGSRARGAYYLNFQDPAGPPLDDPLVVDGHTWTKVGWAPWSEAIGYGWTGEFVSQPAVALHGYSNAAGPYDPVERSYIYDDAGRPNLFEFDLANGRYRVTVGVGRAGQSSLEPHQLAIEGQRVVDDVLPSDIVERSAVVDLVDGRISLVVGGPSETLDAYAYTFLAFLKIEPEP